MKKDIAAILFLSSLFTILTTAILLKSGVSITDIWPLIVWIIIQLFSSYKLAGSFSNILYSLKTRRKLTKTEESLLTQLSFSLLLITLAPLIYKFVAPIYAYLSLFTGGTLLAMVVSGYVLLKEDSS